MWRSLEIQVIRVLQLNIFPDEITDRKPLSSISLPWSLVGKTNCSLRSVIVRPRILCCLSRQTVPDWGLWPPPNLRLCPPSSPICFSFSLCSRKVRVSISYLAEDLLKVSGVKRLVGEVVVDKNLCVSAVSSS